VENQPHKLDQIQQDKVVKQWEEVVHHKMVKEVWVEALAQMEKNQHAQINQLQNAVMEKMLENHQTVVMEKDPFAPIKKAQNAQMERTHHLHKEENKVAWVDLHKMVAWVDLQVVKVAWVDLQVVKVAWVDLQVVQMENHLQSKEVEDYCLKQMRNHQCKEDKKEDLHVKTKVCQNVLINHHLHVLMELQNHHVPTWESQYASLELQNVMMAKIQIL